MVQELAVQLEQAGGEVNHCSGAGFDYEEAWFVAGACLGAINTLFQPLWMQGFRNIVGPA